MQALWKLYQCGEHNLGGKVELQTLRHPKPYKLQWLNDCGEVKTILKQRLLTNAERARRGLAEDPSCPICGHASEDILHVIRNCTLAKEASKQVADVEIESTCGEPLVGEWTYLNKDGAIRVDSGVATAGRVLRYKN
ncbi:hypothetical protein Gogos_006137 [Gossypium gossypioides]|uniref:Reverse transcriptase zinc-binding domain-containing protein n=1 Tax=Gossypium gossypioides TaxID=34282 RepID=A0A7J9C5E4_GOSGO|nr:hypothetical protein [Gossypium gossypioides]